MQTFDTIEDLQQALLAFRQTYNATWLIERHGFITPAAFRRKQLQPRGARRLGFNPVSQELRAVQTGATATDARSTTDAYLTPQTPGHRPTPVL